MRGGGEARLLGQWGEALAAEELRRRGWRILAHGYRCRFGEIDLIAVNREYIAFVEVKLRKSAAYGAARDFVSRKKQERLRVTAQLYLSQNPTELQPRFDVAEIYAPQGMETGQPTVEILENAF